MPERRFPRTVDSLEGIFAFIGEFLRLERVAAEHAFDLDLFAEELFTNMVKYGGGTGAIALALAREGSVVTMTLRDFGGRPFDVTRPRPLPDTPLSERRTGGLGLGLVQRMADGLDYHHDGRCGTVTVRKRIAG